MVSKLPKMARDLQIFLFVKMLKNNEMNTSSFGVDFDY